MTMSKPYGAPMTAQQTISNAPPAGAQTSNSAVAQHAAVQHAASVAAPLVPPGATPTPFGALTVTNRKFDDEGIRLAIGQGLRSFSGCDLSKTTALRGLDLTGAEFIKCDLTGADLRMVQAIQTNFGGSDLSKADLSDACLTQSTLVECNLSGASLERCNMKFARVEGAKFDGANLTGATRVRGDMTIAGWTMGPGGLRKDVQ